MLSHLTTLYKVIFEIYEKLLAFEYIFKFKKKIEKIFKFYINYFNYIKLYSGYCVKKPP